MTDEKRLTCTLDGCGKTFADQAAKNSHRRDKHGKKRNRHGKKVRQNDDCRRHAQPLAGLDRDFIYDMVDGMDLPDGAHWAMIEELSGLEPGDFA
jgi:hypothetical protein